MLLPALACVLLATTPATAAPKQRAPTVQIKPKGVYKPIEVEDTMQKQALPLRRCYEQALTYARPDLEGTLLVTMSIDVRGAVTKVKLVASTLKVPELESCMLTALREVKFPAPRGTQAEITYPIVLKSKP